MNTNGVIFKANTTNSLFQIPLLLHSNKTHHHHHSFFSIQLPRYKLPLSSFHLKLPSGSPLFAPTKGKTNTPVSDNFDIEDDDEEFDDDIIVPLRNMRQWLRHKPSGFGEGKVYDTSMEDKLLEELEQSRVAQIANVNNLKNNPQHNSNKPKQKVPEVVPNGTRVRLINLPKKKNIHRDLQAAFKPFPGIINIIPAVTGNEKTREPVCKGSAFVDFKSEKQANRFVDTFSTQPITFGKVQKQIRCEIMKPSLPNPVSVKPPAHIREKPLPVSNPTVAVNSSTSAEAPLDPFVEDGAFYKFKNGDDDLVSATDEYHDKNFGNFDNVVQERNEPEAGSESLKKKKVTVKGKKTVTGKKKAENTPRLNIPGSANRLKMKEKALLSGVFSKYGGNSAMAAKGTD